MHMYDVSMWGPIFQSSRPSILTKQSTLKKMTLSPLLSFSSKSGFLFGSRNSEVGTALVDMSITYASMFSNEQEDSSQENSAAGAAKNMGTFGGSRSWKREIFIWQDHLKSLDSIE